MLDKVAQTLSQHPDVAATVVGHTDSTGSPNYNLQLSQRRAQSVAGYLGDRGIPRAAAAEDGTGPSPSRTTPPRPDAPRIDGSKFFETNSRIRSHRKQVPLATVAGSRWVADLPGGA